MHNKINPPEPTEAEKSIAALEHKKALFNLMIQQDIDKFKETLKPPPPPPPVPAPTCLTCLANSTCTHNTNGFNITIGGLSTASPKIEISAKPSWTTPTYSTSNLQSTFRTDIGKYPNTVSSYDFPYETSKYCEGLFKSTYNSVELENEVKLLKSIQESQEKLKLHGRIEKTTDLVDDIIGKVKVLQTEMKNKSTALKIETEIQNLKKRRDSLRSASSLSINYLSDLDYLDSDDVYKPHHHHLHSHPCRSRERLSSRSCSRERRRSCSRNKYPASILKTTTTIRESVSPAHHHHHHHKRASSTCSSKKTSFHSSLIDKYGKVRVQPKVDSWNMNCKHDNNID